MYINCFAVDKEFQRIKAHDSLYISDILLADCMNRIESLRQEYVGLAFVSLSSTEEGIHLYERNGFESAADNEMQFAKNPGELKCIPMYLPIDYE